LARSLLHQRLLDQSQDGYSVLSLNESSWQVLREQRAVIVAEAVNADRAPARDTTAQDTAEGNELFERLRKLRKQLADAQGLPPYVHISRCHHCARWSSAVRRRSVSSLESAASAKASSLATGSNSSLP